MIASAPVSMRVLDAVWELGSRFANLNLSWFQALHAVVHTPDPDMNPVVIAHARRELGDDWAGAVYERARAETSAVPDVYIDADPTEPGEPGWPSVETVIRKLSAMRDADPDIGSMRVMLDKGNGLVELDLIKAVATGASGDDGVVIMFR